MECPKCHTIINDKETVCPKCHKVLLLECPNCHSLEETAVCSKCGYKILIKCSKCGKINPSVNNACSKCKFSTKTSLAMQECETDELAFVTIKFSNLKKIKRLLKTHDLYEKFLYKLKNLLLAQTKHAEGLFITYENMYVLNFNKELSFTTSANKAVRFALKFVNAFSQLNLNILEELKLPLGIHLTIAKKSAEELQTIKTYENNIKLLSIKKDEQKYLKGMQIVLDQYTCDAVSKEYKTDSLYSLEENGTTTMFYEIILSSYILPPNSGQDNDTPVAVKKELQKSAKKESDESDMYSFNVFDINAKCTFETANAVSIKEKLQSMDFEKNAKVLSIRSKNEFRPYIKDLVEVCEEKGYKTITVTCNEALCYKPWGFLTKLFKSFYNLPFVKTGIKYQNIPENLSIFEPLFNLCKEQPIVASSPEDARYAYIELWGKFLSILSDTVIIVDGFENIDDTSIQTLELYFDKLRKISPNFILLTSDAVSAHSRIKELLRMNTYTELKLAKSPFANCLSTIKTDASDFIGSFYFEKIQENFGGSYLYFKNVLKYLTETGVLINFENKLLVNSSKSVVVPTNLTELYKARIKQVGKNQENSFILAYSALLSQSLDLDTLELLEIKDLKNSAKILCETDLARLERNTIVIDNFNIIQDLILSSLKKEAEVRLAKTVITKLNTGLSKTATALTLGKIGAFNDEYAILCNNADFGIATGDYDSYLKNCLGFLSLIETIDSQITQENINERKKGVYDSILKYLYSYTPTKIYFIENILLTDAIHENDNDRIVKLSNMMLQGALISSNYTDALGLLHNILSRMQNPTLLVDGAINAKFLLLSLVNIEILYNIGKFKECVETALEILSVLSVEIFEKIKPAGFSLNSFVSHILDSMRLAAFAKLYLMDDGLEDFFERVKTVMNADIPEKDCILAIRNYLSGKAYPTGVIENYSAFSKAIFLILQELSDLKESGNYNKFAQNIYQAKLLAEDLYQTEIKYFCDLLIGYAYAKKGITAKAECIYNDVLNSAEKSAMFNILLISKYLIANLEKNPQKILLTVNYALDLIQKHNNQAIILYVLFEKIYINLAQNKELAIPNIELEEQKIAKYSEILKIITE